MKLKKLLKREHKSLLDAAKVIDKAARKTTGEGRLLLNNAMGHVLSRIYCNGYWTGTQSQVDSWKVQK